MIRVILLFTLSMLLVGCATDTEKTSPASPTLPSDSEAVDMEEATRFVREGLPFPVDIDPSGALYESALSDSELVNLKRGFLQPLARSPHAGKINKVIIDASENEWYQWKCRIEIEELPPIEINHFAGFYNGKTNKDPDAYGASLQYVVKQLANIAQRVGWDQNQGEQAAPSSR